METLRIMLTIATAIMVLICVTSLVRDRERLREYSEAGLRDELITLMDEKKGWIERHLICSALGILFIAGVRYGTSLERFDQLAGYTAVYVALSLFFAFIESLFIQRISQAISVRVKAMQEKDRME